MKSGLVVVEVCAALNRTESRYLIIGGIACILHGHVRATTDIDLVTTYREPEPEALEVIAVHQGSATRPLVVGGVKVDIIPTNPVDDIDLEV